MASSIINNMSINSVKKVDLNAESMEVEWKRFSMEFDKLVEGEVDKTESDMIKLFLKSMGSEAAELLKAFNLSEQELKSYSCIRDAFDRFFIVKIDMAQNWIKFYERIQLENESFEDFLSAVQRLALKCNFEFSYEFLMKWKVLSGLRCKSIKEKISSWDDKNLYTLVALVDKIRSLTHDNEFEMIDCLLCGNFHDLCPALNNKCMKCRKFGHYDANCKYEGDEKGDGDFIGKRKYN